MKALLTLLLVIGTGNVFAQLANATGNNREILSKKVEVDIKGSPYLYDDWKRGNVQTKDGRKFTDVPIRYNFFTDGVELGSEVPGLNTIDIVWFQFPERREYGFRMGFNGIPKSRNDSFLEQLVVGDITLLKRYSASLTDVVVQDYGSATKRKEYLRSIDYYLLSKEGTLTPVSLSRKSIVSALSSYDDGVAEFIRSNKINARREEGLINIVEHVNSPE
jgi:hypothetical protein